MIMNIGNGGFYMSGIHGSFNYNNVRACSYAVRPIVCIPTSVFNSKYLNTIEEDTSRIIFTIDGIEYEAKEGMTWTEWVEENGGNKLGFRVEDAGVINHIESNSNIGYDGLAISSIATIIDDREYYILPDK